MGRPRRTDHRVSRMASGEYNHLVKVLKVLFWGLLLGVFAAGVLHVHRHFIDYPVYETAGLKICRTFIERASEMVRNLAS